MAVSVDELVRELRAFDGRREIVKAASKGFRKAVNPLRAKIRTAALDTLPKRGGLNVWVSRTRITTQIRLSGRKAGVKLKGGRNSLGGRSDIKRIDAGRVRAPSWGHRSRASWHTVTVTPGFFTKTAAEDTEVPAAVGDEVDRALDQIRRG